MKKKYANVTPEQDPHKEEMTLSVEDGHSVSYKDLCQIVRTRMEELMRLILLEMPTSDYNGLAPAGLVLTGGCSSLPGLESLAKMTLRFPVRIGEPMGVYGITDILHSPRYATAVGLLLWGVRNQGRPAWEAKRQSGVMGSFLTMFKRFFGAA
jgi:cell division protein FtsA